MRRLLIGLLLAGVTLAALAGCQRTDTPPATKPTTATVPQATAPAPRSSTLRASMAGLKDPNPGIRMLAVRDLVRLGPEAKPALEPLLKVVKDDPDPPVRLFAAKALGAIGPEARAAVPRLIEVLEKDHDPSVRAYAAEALAEIGSGPEEAQLAVGPLTRALKDDSDYVRKYAAKALRKIRPDAGKHAGAP